MSSGCFVALLLVIISFVLQVLCTPFVHFFMGLIVCAAVIKMKMAMVAIRSSKVHVLQIVLYIFVLNLKSFRYSFLQYYCFRLDNNKITAICLPRI